MNESSDIIVQIELHAVEGIIRCFQNGITTNDISQVSAIEVVSCGRRAMQVPRRARHRQAC